MVPVPATLLGQRLHNQFITRPGPRNPARVVEWFGVVQAQEFGPAKWALGLRMPPSVTDATIQRAFDAGKILRTHVLRPTWHFVSPKDIRWMLELSAPYVSRRMAPYDRQLGLDARIKNRATAIIERALADHEFLTRNELGEHLARARLQDSGTHLAHLAMHAELEGVICSGPRRGKQSTYALLDRRSPPTPKLSRDEALERLTRVFLRSHGPATHRDFSWWSGLTAADAKRGIDMVRATRIDADGLTFWTLGTGKRSPIVADAVQLLPIYDEFVNAYRDLRGQYHGPSMVASKKGGYGTFQHAVLIGGRVVGTWRGAPGDPDVHVILPPTRKLRSAEKRNLEAVLERYRRFVTGSRAVDG